MIRAKTIITDVDLERISELLNHFSPAANESLALLEEKLLTAEIIKQTEAPPDLVTMNSEVCAKPLSPELEEDVPHNLALVYPTESDVSEGKISILAPLGLALLGAKANSIVSWKGRNGKHRSVRIDKITYQPEAFGHWHR